MRIYGSCHLIINTKPLVNCVVPLLSWSITCVFYMITQQAQQAHTYHSSWAPILPSENHGTGNTENLNPIKYTATKALWLNKMFLINFSLWISQTKQAGMKFRWVIQYQCIQQNIFFYDTGFGFHKSIRQAFYDILTTA